MWAAVKLYNLPSDFADRTKSITKLTAQVYHGRDTPFVEFSGRKPDHYQINQYYKAWIPKGKRLDGVKIKLDIKMHRDQSWTMDLPDIAADYDKSKDTRVLWDIYFDDNRDKIYARGHITVSTDRFRPSDLGALEREQKGDEIWIDNF